MFQETDAIVSIPSHVHTGKSDEELAKLAKECLICHAKSINELFEVVFAELRELRADHEGHGAWIRAHSEHHVG